MAGELGGEDGDVLSANIYQDAPNEPCRPHTMEILPLESRGRSADGLRGRVTLETMFEEQDYCKRDDSGQQKPTCAGLPLTSEKQWPTGHCCTTQDGNHTVDQ